VHGRFQPFHNGHLEYVLAAKGECEFLWIGITMFDTTPHGLSPLGLPREHPQNNPLTYFERISVIAEALKETGASRDSFGFIPFPIETPENLSLFLPTDIACFTTVCEPWNEKKIEVLTAAGYPVRVLWKKDKTVSGSNIRDRIMAGDPTWRELVPASTARAVDRLNIAERLRELHRTLGGLRQPDKPEDADS
jgi:nicotinamide-nucleotide adenylyltransferase